MPDVPTHVLDLPTARHLQHLGQHPGGGVGTACVRPLRRDLRPHLQGARDGKGSLAPRLRRDPGARTRAAARPRAWSSTSRRRPAASPWPTRRPTGSRPRAMYGESEDITGGMGLEGAAELNRFVAEGGLLITLASSSVFPGRVRPHAASGRGRVLPASSTPPVPSCRRRSRSPSTPSSGATPRRRWACGTRTAPCSGCPRPTRARP